jgi:hypothetical protein
MLQKARELLLTPPSRRWSCHSRVIPRASGGVNSTPTRPKR